MFNSTEIPYQILKLNLQVFQNDALKWHPKITLFISDYPYQDRNCRFPLRNGIPMNEHGIPWCMYTRPAGIGQWFIPGLILYTYPVLPRASPLKAQVAVPGRYLCFLQMQVQMLSVVSWVTVLLNWTLRRRLRCSCCWTLLLPSVLFEVRAASLSIEFLIAHVFLRTLLVMELGFLQFWVLSVCFIWQWDNSSLISGSTLPLHRSWAEARVNLHRIE